MIESLFTGLLGTAAKTPYKAIVKMVLTPYDPYYTV